MDSRKAMLILSVSLFSIVGGCATGHRASLDIRSRDHFQATPIGERSIEHGKLLLRRGQYADAISAFRTALREESGSAEAHNGLAVAYDSIGRKDLARRYFELAVAERPDDDRYRNNLARFFEGSGHSELADGLRNAPALLAKTEATQAQSETVLLASATVDQSAPEEVVDSSAQVDELVATIMADLSDRRAGKEHFVVADDTASLAVLPFASGDEPVQRKMAVYRQTMTPAIKAAPIQLHGEHPPRRDPLDGRFALVADLPRGFRRQTVSQGPYIERVSLGEVNIITQSMLPKSKVGIDLDHLEDELALWADNEKRSAEYEPRTGLNGRLAIQHAVERAAMDEAIASTVSIAALIEQIDKDFVYHFYDDANPALQEFDA
jgi:hypothetical protein